VFNIGPAELMVIFILALLVFGPKKLPEVSRQIGRGIREFRRASDSVRGEIEGALSMDDHDDDASDEDAPDEDDDEPSESRHTPTISTNGHSAGSAEAVPEATDGAGQGDEGPAASERTD
jgi:sec-independent protein translocase protein TatA